MKTENMFRILLGSYITITALDAGNDTAYLLQSNDSLDTSAWMSLGSKWLKSILSIALLIYLYKVINEKTEKDSQQNDPSTNLLPARAGRIEGRYGAEMFSTPSSTQTPDLLFRSGSASSTPSIQQHFAPA